MKKSKTFSKTKISYLGKFRGNVVNGFIDKDTDKAYVSCKVDGVEHKVEITGSWENKKHLQSALFALEQEVASTERQTKKNKRKEKLEQAKVESDVKKAEK